MTAWQFALLISQWALIVGGLGLAVAAFLWLVSVTRLNDAKAHALRFSREITTPTAAPRRRS